MPKAGLEPYPKKCDEGTFLGGGIFNCLYSSAKLDQYGRRGGHNVIIQYFAEYQSLSSVEKEKLCQVSWATKIAGGSRWRRVAAVRHRRESMTVAFLRDQVFYREEL